MVKLQGNQANIVGKILSAGKLLNFLDELSAEFLALEVDPFTHALQQSILIKKLRIVPGNFKKPIREEEDSVAFTEFARETLILGVSEDSENRIKL